MTHRKSLLRYGGFVFSVGGARVVGILISSLTFPYLVRRLGVEMYGLWSYVVAVCGFLNVIADPGINTYTTQQLAARREAGFELIPDVLLLRLIGSLTVMFVVFGIAAFETRSDTRALLRLYGIGILLVNLISADHLLAALEMFHVRSLLTVAQQAAYALGIFTLVHSSKDVLWVPVSILGSSALTGLAAWIVLWQGGLKLHLTLRPERWKGILVPSFHYAASSLMSNVYHRAGHLLVRWFLGDVALGLYAAAARLVDILRGFVIIVLQVVMPRMALSAQSGAELRRLGRFTLAVIATISIPLAIGLIGTAHLVVPWVLGPKYLADISLLRWMALYLITAPLASLFAGTILFSMGRHRAYLASTAAGATSGVVLYLTLIPALGVKGAALALVLAEVVVAGVAFAQLPELHDSWKNPTLAISMACALLMLIAVKLANAYTSQAIVVISAGACIYVMSCGWFARKLVAEARGL
jgi:O-antigen/teichoic acid export membrane protein